MTICFFSDVTSPRHASVKFSSGEVSMNMPPGGSRQSRKKSSNKQAETPVSLQKLFNTSVSEMGESTVDDMSLDTNQVISFYTVSFSFCMTHVVISYLQYFF